MSRYSLKELKNLVENAIENLKLPDFPERLYQPVRYTLKGGGKRLRPLIMLSTVCAFGKDPRNFISQAVALELFHNSTLIHDDVMDNSEMRHGRLTVHRKWDTTTAILSGDTMISLANKYMATEVSDKVAAEIIRIFNDLQIRVDEGQQMDIDFETSDNVTLEDYRQMILGKTGALFAAAVSIGYLLAVPVDSPEAEEKFRIAIKLGYTVGEIFQLQDDMLDTYGDSKNFGKPIGQDIINNKKTWLSVSLLHSPLRKRALHVMTDIKEPIEKIGRMIELYDELDLHRKLKDLIDSKNEEADALLSDLTSELQPQNIGPLSEILGSIAHRDR